MSQIEELEDDIYEEILILKRDDKEFPSIAEKKRQNLPITNWCELDLY